MSFPTQDFSLIKNVLDKYFDFRNEIGGDSFITELIPETMLAPGESSEDISKWLPIASTVDEATILELENLYQHKLPESYKFLLQQRHFVELGLGAYDIIFFKSYPGSLVADFREIIEGNFSELVERGYLPFAYHSDYGVVCFDATKAVEGNDYPVVWFDHEDGYDQVQFYDNNFLEMFREFNEHLDQTIIDVRKARRKPGN